LLNMNLEFVRQLRFEPIVQRYDARDCALYALSLGMGDDPLDEDELPFVYEGRGPRAVPSQCVTLCWPPFWHREPAARISWRRILHGEQSFTLCRPLLAQAVVRGHHSIVAVEDKGASRGAVVYTSQDLVDAGSGEKLASLCSAEFLRDEGGCGGFGAPPTLTRPLGTIAEPAVVVDYRTSRQAALLYRQASRDYMPIHADPDIARDAGFERPISHGLNMFGLVCRAALKHFAPGHPEELKSMSVRFAAPAYPGDTIHIELFATAQGVRFRASALERNVMVLDRGEIQFA
jgi:acyl dehydratase